ncbi:MAG: low-specificity L-threonine aldolase [Desulfobacterales bacterium]|nr:low-specificity L-threonine aldolase [Desulfobacterales bacterium]
MDYIDLRSDTVTRPTPEMRRAMADAAVGDDVYGEDPTVNRLEERAAEILGTEAALYCTSGTQSNLLGLLSHCQRGEEYIVGQTAHTYRYEAGGAAVLGSIQPQPLEFEVNGTLDLDRVASVIKPDDFHFARTRLLCLENTTAGRVLPMDYLARARTFTRDHNLGLHLDGARVFNAAVKLGLDVREITQHFDTISCCLSKGLGAPVGSILCGPKPFIDTARRWRKMVGGGMRQAGIIAAAGLHALEHHVDRLSQDHDNARILAQGLSEIQGISIVPESVQTNILFADMAGDMTRLAAHMKERGILVDDDPHLRLVTHLGIHRNDIDKVISAFKDFFTS